MTIPKYKKGNLYQLTPDDLQTDPNQPRKYFDPEALNDLVNSILARGVLQPVLFRVDEAEKLFLVAGERRLQAAKQAKIKTIPAILVEGNTTEIALVENLLREDLTAIEFAEALERIQQEYNYTQEQLTGIVGKAKSTISEILSLNKLPEKIKNECRNDPSIPRKTLIKIASKKREKGMVSAYGKYKAMLAAPKKSRGPKGKRKSPVERLASKYEALTVFVTEMNWGSIDDASRSDLISMIDAWKKSADEIIEKVKNAPKYEPPPAKEPKFKRVVKEEKKSVAKKEKPRAKKKVKTSPVSKTKK